MIFQNKRDLYTHWKSTTHATQQYTCPGNDCSKAFGTPSAVIQHLESGACVSGMTRQRVNRMAIAADRGAVITNPARIAADNERLSMPEPVATTAWFNGSSYECIICHRTCRTLVGLNRHLRSPAHSEKILKSPMGRSDRSLVQRRIVRDMDPRGMDIKLGARHELHPWSHLHPRILGILNADKVNV